MLLACGWGGRSVATAAVVITDVVRRDFSLSVNLTNFVCELHRRQNNKIKIKKKTRSGLVVLLVSFLRFD